VDEPRDLGTRVADTRAMLATPAIDAWVATATPAGAPHLVPLSLAWVREHVVLALSASSLTARNLRASGRARIGVGPTRDVVLLDAVLEEELDASAACAWGDAFAEQTDWDPRGVQGYVVLVLRPTRMQAWREENEIPGRTVMRNGQWLDGPPDVNGTET
jgi:hypothetical protein